MSKCTQGLLAVNSILPKASPFAQNVLRGEWLCFLCGYACLTLPRLACQSLSVYQSGVQYLAAATLRRPPMLNPEKSWKPQHAISTYLGVPKHFLHLEYEGSDQSLLRKVDKHLDVASIRLTQIRQFAAATCWLLARAALFSQSVRCRFARSGRRVSSRQLLHRFGKVFLGFESLFLSARKLPECKLLRFLLYSASQSGVVARKVPCFSMFVRTLQASLLNLIACCRFP